MRQICLPAQTEEMHWLTFSPVEEHFYRRQYQDCAREAMQVSAGCWQIVQILISEWTLWVPGVYQIWPFTFLNMLKLIVKDYLIYYCRVRFQKLSKWTDSDMKLNTLDRYTLHQVSGENFRYSQTQGQCSRQVFAKLSSFPRNPEDQGKTKTGATFCIHSYYIHCWDWDKRAVTRKLSEAAFCRLTRGQQLHLLGHRSMPSIKLHYI